MSSDGWRLEGRYQFQKVEESVLNFWNEKSIYKILKAKNSNKVKLFNFIDGPPYPSGEIPHIGTAWNKSLKDSILRFRRMQGFRVYDQPGYDCHGLPIEVKVEQKLGLRVKREIEEKIGVDRFINECKNLALTNAQAMTKWFIDLGVFMDWENPYLTLRDEYIEASWWLVKKADEKGLLDREARIVHWCPRCSTTLAEYEIEYKELEDPSIYVKFPVVGEEKTFLVIWTTTPWTIPSNTFVMIHPDADYVKIKVGDENLILAEARLQAFLEDTGIEKYEVVARIKGKDLLGVKYTHPLKDVVPIQTELEKYHTVLPAPEFVTMYEGTGLVHSAPGHGFEDYIVAMRNGVSLIASPVDDEGKFTSEAGKYAGLYVREANTVIIEDLEKKNAILSKKSIRHKYPVCWRCKTPVFLRATQQWVIKVSKLKDKLLEEVKKVNWIPEWALDRINGMIVNLQDWVISRQRYWGTPLPIWICPNGHKVVIGSIDEIFALGGHRPKELHKPWIDEVTLKCPKCGREMKRVPDVMDVWFDSGVCFYAAKGHPGKEDLGDVRLDLIIEGHDQTRGWFFSLLRAGILGFDEAPYRNVLVHGFMLDEQGREMHKSLGNYVGTNEAIEKVGRDPLRLWLLSNTTWEDARFSWRSIEEVARDLSIIWNIYVFAKTYMDLDKYNPEENDIKQYLDALRFEDKWILSRVNTLIKEVTSHLEEYEVHAAVRLLREFAIEDLSHWYIRLIRSRVWVEENTRDKLAAYTVLYYVLEKLARMLAPFVPFITEYIYQSMFKQVWKEESIHLLEWPKADETFIDTKSEETMNIIKKIFETAATARMKAGLKLRQPVKKLTVYSNDLKIIETVAENSELIKLITNTKGVDAKPVSMLQEVTRYKVEPVYSVIGPRFKQKTKQVVDYILHHQEEIARDVLNGRAHEAIIQGEQITIDSSCVRIIPYYIEGYSVVDTEWGSIGLDTRLSEEEVAEGLARDLVRRIQVMRKMLNLPLDAKIKVVIITPTERENAVKSRANYIANETRACEIIISSEPALIKGFMGDVKEWDIDGETYYIGVMPV
ncbi:MAG: isoleucine--tRNA ligase [Thermosphaera sp.]